MFTPTSSTTSTFSLFDWPQSPRPNTGSNSGWNPESDPKQASGRELAERLRPSHCAPCTPKETFDQWAARVLPAVPSVRSYPYIDPPTAATAPAGPTVIPATDTSIQADEVAIPALNFDPYGWAALLWVGGLVLDHNAYHLMPYFWVVVALVGCVFRYGPHYLFTSGVAVALGYFLLRNYLPL